LPFKTHAGFELFNDCLYYRRIAKDFIARDEKAYVFEIRRALRSSFVFLCAYLDSTLTFALYSALTGHLFTVKKKARLEDEEIIRFKRLGRLGFQDRLVLLELLSGKDLHLPSSLQERIDSVFETRNDILHAGRYDWNPFRKGRGIQSNDEFLKKLADGIGTVRTFIRMLSENELSSKDDFLAYEEPVHMRELGYGYLPIKGSTIVSMGEDFVG
jgi:hypothetical protein